MEYPTAPSPLDRSVAYDAEMEAIPFEKRCTECGRECVGSVIARGGVDRICTHCFRVGKNRITMEEAMQIPWRK